VNGKTVRNFPWVSAVEGCPFKRGSTVAVTCSSLSTHNHAYLMRSWSMRQQSPPPVTQAQLISRSASWCAVGDFA